MSEANKPWFLEQPIKPPPADYKAAYHTMRKELQVASDAKVRADDRIKVLLRSLEDMSKQLLHSRKSAAALFFFGFLAAGFIGATAIVIALGGIPR